MWFQRFVSWLRSFMSAGATEAVSPSTPPTSTGIRQSQDAEFQATQSLEGVSGLPDANVPQRREPPSTIPMTRFIRPLEPYTSAPNGGDGAGASTVSFSSREPSQPSQPLAASLHRVDDWSDAQDETQMSDAEQPLLDETVMRQLRFLRRLVRQRVYNEGFSLSETPMQYRRSLGLDERDDTIN